MFTRSCLHSLLWSGCIFLAIGGTCMHSHTSQGISRLAPNWDSYRMPWVIKLWRPLELFGRLSSWSTLRLYQFLQGRIPNASKRLLDVVTGIPRACLYAFLCMVLIFVFSSALSPNKVVVYTMWLSTNACTIVYSLIKLLSFIPWCPFATLEISVAVWWTLFF